MFARAPYADTLTVVPRAAREWQFIAASNGTERVVTFVSVVGGEP